MPLPAKYCPECNHDYSVSAYNAGRSSGRIKREVLGCWCHPLPCHGDILIRLVKQKFAA